MNKKRQLEIDIVKGLAIFFMFLVHCYEDYGADSIQQQGFLSHLIFFLGGPLAAPVFMFCMGIGMNYTRKQSSKEFLKHGLSLFIIGYLLNFVRDFIPYTIQGYIHHDSSLSQTAWDYLLCTDVLPFAGLAYIFMGFFKKLKLKDYWLFLFYAICAITNVLLSPIKIENRALASLTGLLWSSWDCTWFPFLSWIAFPIAGYLFGKQLVNQQNTDEFYKKVLTWSGLPFFPLLIVMYGLKINCGALDGFFDINYFHMNWFGNIMILDVVILWICFWHFASDNLPNIMKHTLTRWSKQINTMYIVQWIFIGYGNLVFGYFEHSLIEVLLLFVFTLAASDLLTTLFTNYKRKVHL